MKRKNALAHKYAEINSDEVDLSLVESIQITAYLVGFEEAKRLILKRLNEYTYHDPEGAQYAFTAGRGLTHLVSNIGDEECT